MQHVQRDGFSSMRSSMGSNRSSVSGKLLIVCAFVITTVVLVTYYPALKIGITFEGWQIIDVVGRLGFSGYAGRFFDPTLHEYWWNYRRMQFIETLCEYYLLKSNLAGYNLVQISTHLANSILTLFLVNRLTRQWRVALLSGLLFATFPIFTDAVLRVTSADPLMTFFYLLAIWFWLDYLRTGRNSRYGLTLGVFVLAFLTKELALTLPITLFLLDQVVVAGNASKLTLLRRYSWLILASFLLVAFEFGVMTNGYYAHDIGFSSGLNIFTNAVQYLLLLAFPWQLNTQGIEILGLMSLALYLFVTIKKRSTELAFLGFETFLNIAPVLGFPQDWFQVRYLYLSGVAAAILYALLLVRVGSIADNWKRIFPFSAVIVLLLVISSMDISGEAMQLAELARTGRLPFHEVTLQHTTFPQQSLLYYIDSPTNSRDLSGMFFLRYGEGVVVDGTDNAHPAGLHNHTYAFVYYSDDQGRLKEQLVAKENEVQSELPLPVDFGGLIRLEGYEIANARMRRGDALIGLIYWRATGKISKDYTVFAHLVNEKGEIVADSDSEPRGGKAPTHSWVPGALIVDWVVIPITADLPVDKHYRLEIGWYDLATSERISIVDQQGQPTSDMIVIQPFSIEE